jgi:hypothetical protein
MNERSFIYKPEFAIPHSDDESLETAVATLKRRYMTSQSFTGIPDKRCPTISFADWM